MFCPCNPLMTDLSAKSNRRANQRTKAGLSWSDWSAPQVRYHTANHHDNHRNGKYCVENNRGREKLWSLEGKRDEKRLCDWDDIAPILTVRLLNWLWLILDLVFDIGSTHHSLHQARMFCHSEVIISSICEWGLEIQCYEKWLLGHAYCTGLLLFVLCA